MVNGLWNVRIGGGERAVKEERLGEEVTPLARESRRCPAPSAETEGRVASWRRGTPKGS